MDSKSGEKVRERERKKGKRRESEERIHKMDMEGRERRKGKERMEKEIKTEEVTWDRK